MRALILSLLVSGCGWTNVNIAPGPAYVPQRAVRAVDLAAWAGVPAIELETHLFFSTLTRKTTDLSDGRQLWDYANGRCHNQFFVKGTQVESYRPVGGCYTDCVIRPSSRSCSSDELVAESQANRTRAQNEANHIRWQRLMAQWAREQHDAEQKRVTTECQPDGLGGMHCESH